MSPSFAIAFSGCDLRCAFCITGAESWNPRAGEPFQAAELARQAANAVDRGARTIMILGGEPTVHLPAALELVALLPACWYTRVKFISQPEMMRTELNYG